MQRPTHILNAASNLVGIALIIITGLNVSHMASRTFADEVAWIAAICLLMSCLLSYLTLRHAAPARTLERWADRIFLVGLLCLVGSVVVLAIGNR